MADTQIALFRNKGIRKTTYKGEWYFVIIDIISALTDSVQPSGYIKDMRRRDPELSKGWGQIATPLLINTTGGKQKMNCASTESILRIIQSVPSQKAEPMKRWLAKVGFERIQEIEDPELATKRTRYLYKAKGYPDSWIEKRMRGIIIREELTNEWKSRGIEKDLDYKILTSEISKATFGVTPSQYKKLKGLKRQNLRDHMDDFELIFTMLGERSTTEIHKVEDSKGFTKLKKDAEEGGEIAGVARRKLEKRIKRSIVTKQNFLPK
ncbi:MAG: Bro-N domain-containing protein [Candidatus Woesebacteria bacterium]|nr:Bro-N domain-containing protein [Candidatus Woesebacteria bacterium]